MFRFNKINGNLYRYRGVDVKIQFNDDGNASMLAEFTNDSGESVQFYSHGIDFEKVKQIVINRIDEHLEKSSSDHS